jgi:hypothetical protein
VILFGHSPPGKSERSGQHFTLVGERRRHDGQHWLQDKFNRRYLQVLISPKRHFGRKAFGQIFICV